MHKFLFSFLLMSFTVLSYAQSDHENWFTDFETANQFATEHDGYILMVFAGSDWCKPCIQLKKDILTSDDFNEFAKDKMAILYLDFPARKKNRLSESQTAHNESLAEQYNRNGAFPKIVLLDSSKEIVAQPEFKGQSAESFIAELKEKLPIQ